MPLNSSTPFNAFQRAGFVLAPSASQSFGDGVYPKTAFPVADFKRSRTVGMDVRTWLRNSVGNRVVISRSTTVGIRRSIERNITRSTKSLSL